MNINWKDRLSADNLKRQGMNTVWVALGVLGSTLLDRLVQKGLDKFVADAPEWIKYVKPAAPILTGLAMSVLAPAGEAGDRIRLIGYGVSGAGVISGLRLIPQFEELMSGTDPAAEKTIQGLNGLLGLTLGDFGATDNIRQVGTADAESSSLDLPDLSRSTDDSATARRRAQQPEVNEDFEEVFAEVI